MSLGHRGDRLSPLALELLNTTDEQLATYEEGAKEGLIELAPVVLPEQPMGDNNHLGFAEATQSGDTLVVIHRRRELWSIDPEEWDSAEWRFEGTLFAQRQDRTDFYETADGFHPTGAVVAAHTYVEAGLKKGHVAISVEGAEDE